MKEKGRPQAGLWYTIGAGMKIFGLRSTYDKLNKMLDDAMSGCFEESNYDESELSKLEVKWKRYLTSSKLSRKKIEEERENIKELVTDISHQTKTPLSNILLYSQLLQEQSLDTESRKMAEEIKNYSEKLDFLIQSLVKTSRLETGTFQLSPVNCDINSLISLVVNQAEKRALDKKIEIQIKADKESFSLFDRKWTGEAVYNILDNAIKYSAEGSIIQIRNYDYEMFGCLEIADQGIGILEEEIPKIFGRFYRGSNVTEKEGIGIGLYLSRQIIECQGGYIKVSSELSKGSKFQVFLPKER